MENEFAVNRDVSHEEVEQNSAHDSLVKVKQIHHANF